MAADRLPPEVLAVLARLEAAGEEGWLVGGCVRDRLLGRPVHDYDIAVSCPPARTAALFSGHELVLAGAAHGTVGVVVGGRLLELTTFRAEPTGTAATRSRWPSCRTSTGTWPAGTLR